MIKRIEIHIKAAAYLLALSMSVLIAAEADAQRFDDLTPLVRTVDVNVGEAVQVELHDGTTADVEILAVDAEKDAVMDAVRDVRVTVRVNGETKTIHSGNYNLPVEVAGVQIDSPVSSDYMERTSTDWWGLDKDVRLRLWPAGSPYVWPGTFVYPVGQDWLATLTQYGNEPVFGSPRPNGEIYYHAGLDLGGAEDMVEVFAATDGLVVSARGDVLSGEPDEPISERYDVVYLRDARGWYYRYSHFDSISPDVQVGQRILAGEKLGMVGKEGGSGGWSHLHFHIMSKQPSGKWGIQEGYAFLWQAYLRQYDPDILAVARPHKVAYVGEPVAVSAEKSWSKNGIRSYEWTLSDGSKAEGPEIERTYDRPGKYSEIVKVTDREGNYDFDFASVRVFEEGNNGESQPPRIYATFYPTTDIKPGDKVFFKVRSQNASEGYDIWDFDDGSDPARVKSDIETDNHAKIGYATTSHRFDEPGDYLVKVQRDSPEGIATDYVHVKVQAP